MNILQKFYAKVHPYQNVLIFLFCCIGTGISAINGGQDVNWDLQNYHFYNPYAFLNNRLTYDWAPAMIQSYNNPLMDLPVYWLIRNLKPIQVGFLLGAVQGVNLFVLYHITKKLFFYFDIASKEWMILVACYFGFNGVFNLSEIGATFGDNIVSLFVLCPLYYLLQHLTNNSSGERIHIKSTVLIVSGLVMGFGVGVKLTLAFYPVALAIAMTWISRSVKDYFRINFIFVSSVFVGFMVSMGHWMLSLWKTFGNPLFPYFNGFFKSSFHQARNISDKRFLPDDIWQTLFYPFYFTKYNSLVSEEKFVDYRLAVCYSLFVIGLIYILYKIKTQKKNLLPEEKKSKIPVSLFFITFFVFSYIFWQKIFSIYRYIVVLEYLSPLFILIVLYWLPISRKKIVAGFLLITIVVMTTMRGVNWGRASWGDSYFGVEIPKIDDLDKSNIIIGGGDAVAYIIPYFPDSTRFLRVQGNFIGLVDKRRKNDKVKGEIQKLIWKGDRPNYLLMHDMDSLSVQTFQYEYKVLVDSSNCTYFKTRFNQKECLCKLLTNK